MSNLPQASQLIDRFGRKIDYLRISITDRCDFRCVYCMAEDMTFLPRAQILTLEEIETIARAFTELGVKKIRITGGEPLVRKGVLDLLENLGKLQGLRELVITTNGAQLESMAPALKRAGVRRINVSLDSLDPAKFKAITRVGNLQAVLNGIAAAKAQGFERIKLNTVVLKGSNHEEICELVQFAVDSEIDISFIEEMPLGIVAHHDRALAYYSSDRIKKDLESRFTLLATPEKTGGPSHYFRVGGTATRVGFISPHSHNFCSACNRVRLTAEGRLLLCLGNEHSVDLKKVVRTHPGDIDALKRTLIDAMQIKPLRHEFNMQEQPVILRYMNMTGG
ncbi:GTP 3',8-cyclase MoaA [Candidatus Methylomicrobium oryzae]|jgi:cyclic pyranopterin phosphate synthase|uniref:GTP 3',8-cyclase MoaA n=1 Tax=Candidatus Methylomicrobium oryzae TaxID=2802053 RepID=UPI0019239150|nr:GTP 3',8-cyclase MoaA [Methylomicrobium sp. RS1]MBL1264671.1 GTP 3',8-cyclase MoaA [Methylomicrobium sp. RS1]